MIERAWSLTGDFAALKKTLAAAADNDADVALELARFDALDSDVGAALEAERRGGLVVPLVLARSLAATEPRVMGAGLEAIFRVMDERAKPALHLLADKCQAEATALMAKTKHDAWAVRALQQSRAIAIAALARLGDTHEAEAMVATHKWMLRVLVPHGIGVDAAIAQIEKVVDDEDSLREVATLLPVLARSGNPKLVPAMLSLLRSGIAIHALAALATMDDARAIEPTHAFLRETGGDDDEVRILAFAAQSVLWRHGETFPLDVAREAIAWPTIRYHTDEPEALLMRVLAIDALRIGSTSADRELARAQVQSPYRVVRDAAMKAFDTPPKLTGWDRGRVAWAQKNDPKALALALEDPHAFFVHHVAEALANDPKAKSKVIAFVTKRIESMPAQYKKRVELDVDVKSCIAIARSLAKGPEKKLFEQSACAWIHVKVLEEDEDAYEAKDAITPSPRAVVVTRFDRPASYFPDATHIALAANAERMVVIATSESFVFDPQRSERVVSLGSGEGVSACAISADGSRVALACGANVEVREGSTVVTRAEITASALAFSANGASLACGSAKKLHVIDAKGSETFAIDAPGACRGVAWLAPSRVVFLVDQGKKSVLVDVDVAKKKHTEVAVARSTMLASNGKLLATAGGKSLRLHDSKLKTKVEATCAEAIVAIGIESEKALIAATAKSLVRVRIGGKAPKEENVSRGSVKLLAAIGARIYGWADGAVERFHKDDAGRNAIGAHFDHVTGVRALRDGRVVTSGWEGRVLLWNSDGGVAETLYERNARVDSLALAPDDSAIYFDDGHNLRAIELASRSTKFLVGGEDVEADLAEHMPEVGAVAATKERIAWGGNAIHVVDIATGDEIFSASVSPESLAWGDDGNIYSGGERGGLACVDGSGTVRWSRIEHGIDVLDGKLRGNPHRNVAAIATRGRLLASLGSDNTVRVFELPSGERKMRWFRSVGIFNGVDISPNGKLVAFTWDSSLEIVDIAKVETFAFLDSNAWSGAVGLGGLFSRPSLMALAWIDDATLIVGAETGALFRVTL